jgi:hypothetical protein
LNRRCSAGSRACRGLRGGRVRRRANHPAVRLFCSYVEGEDGAAIRCDGRQSIGHPELNDVRTATSVGPFIEGVDNDVRCCSGCAGYPAAEQQFGSAVAEGDLRRYQNKGPEIAGSCDGGWRSRIGGVVLPARTFARSCILRPRWKKSSYRAAFGGSVEVSRLCGPSTCMDEPIQRNPCQLRCSLSRWIPYVRLRCNRCEVDSGSGHESEVCLE